jgi:chemotaxis protein CheD
VRGDLVSEKDSVGRKPGLLRGYEHVHRYWDRTFACHAAKILPGEYYVTTDGEMITTVLGSCVSACIRDRLLGVGGMNHFMLPEAGPSRSGDCVSKQARYGSYAMERLINEIIKHGGKRENLEAKLFGGGQVLANMTDVGSRNIDFVREYVRQEQITVTAEDLGSVHPRRVVFFPSSGRVMVKRLLRLENDTICEREKRYQEEISQPKQTGEVELF